MDDPWTKTAEEVINGYRTDEQTGLNDEQIKTNTAKYGPNGKLKF